jgi:hypothetical protein
VPLFLAGKADALKRLFGREGSRTLSDGSPPRVDPRPRQRVEVRVGTVLAGNDVALYQDDETLTNHLRFNTYLLKPRVRAESVWRRPDA